MDADRLPRHIAIIMDGNGRWAAKHGVPRAMGHKAGCDALEQLVEDAAVMGLEYLTVYGFSTENWKRSKDEIASLMNLFRYYFGRIMKKATENNIRCVMLGEKSRFEPDIIEEIDELVDATKDNTGMTFSIAANYGGRDEIVRAARKIVTDFRENGRDTEDIDEEFFAGYLDTAGMPDPDLMIRTSGEMRLSNYLLWQLAYSELYVTDCLWPDFDKEELIKAIEAYQGRDRRFGGR